MSDIEKVRAKSNHLPAPSLKGAARCSPARGRGAGETKDGGHGVTEAVPLGRG